MANKLNYHVFGDGWDRWFESEKEARKLFEQSTGPRRLYWQDENEEVYLDGRGPFPW